MAAVADGTQSGGRRMLLVVHFGRILDQQDLRLLAGRLARLLHVRRDQVLIAHLRRLQKAIGGFGGRPALHLSRQGGRRIVGDGLGHLDGALGAILVTQAHRAKGVLGPLLGRQQGACIHQFWTFSFLSHSCMHSITHLLHFCDKQSVPQTGSPKPRQGALPPAPPTLQQPCNRFPRGLSLKQQSGKMYPITLSS